MLAQLRPALRALRRAPTFTAAAVLCVALGVGANTAIFSAVGAVLLHPVATPAIDRVVAVRQDLIPIKLLDLELAPPEVLDLAERRALFSHVAGYSTRGVVLDQGGATTRFEGARTLGDFFALFGVRPHLGRLYTADDSRDGRHLVAVLTYGLWQEQFGGDPGVVGRTVRLNDLPHEVIGVLPPEFRYPRQARILAPVRVDSNFAQSQRGRQYITAVARLRDGVSVGQAQAGLEATMAAWRARDGDGSTYGVAGKHRMYVVPFVAFDAGQLRPVLYVLLGAVGVVLLIACANVASLQLVRATARARELAVHAALGAGRARIVRQLLGESALLALAGGALGLAVGWATTRLLVALAPADQPALRDLRLDGPVLLATALATAAAALLSGTLPALRGARVDLRSALQDGARGGTAGGERHRVLRAAVVGQVALSFVLLLGSGVMLRSLARLLAVDPGFRPARVLAASVTLPFARYAKTADALRFYAEVSDRLRAAPGVEAVGVTSWLPLRDGGGSSSPFRIRGRDTTGQAEPPHANMAFVDPGYFRTMGIPLLRGRTFSDRPPTGPADGAPREFLIDEQLAKQYFPNEDPVGRTINQGPDGVIVGVVGSVRQEALGAPNKAQVYYDYRASWATTLTLVVRSTLPDDAAARAVRAAAAAVDPQVPLYDVAAMPEVVARSVGTRRFGVLVLGGFAALSVTLALLGVYGVLSYAVLQRRRELGIRAALGARGRDVAALVLGSGARMAVWGLALGALAYAALGRTLESLVYGVGPRDPLTFAAGAALLGAAALAACWLPARRAARVDPAIALRAE